MIFTTTDKGSENANNKFVYSAVEEDDFK